MQPRIRIYYSIVYLLLNMFRATHLSSSGAQNCKIRGCNYSFELLMMSGVSLETC
jgi:hypothetical protein